MKTPRYHVTPIRMAEVEVRLSAGEEVGTPRIHTLLVGMSAQPWEGQCWGSLHQVKSYHMTQQCECVYKSS